MALSILSDMKITDEEHEFLESLLDRMGLQGEERRQARALNVDDDPVALVNQITSKPSIEELLSEVVQAIKVDGEVTRSERDMLEQVGQALGFDTAQLELLLGAA